MKELTVQEHERLIRVARGDERADMVLKNAAYTDVFSGDVKRGDIAIACGRIAGVGSYVGEEELDFSRLVVTPGFIDGHVHIESSQLSPEEYASLVVPRGTTAVVADPHEIVNVCGMAGAEYMRKASSRTPLDVILQLPSCVPATPFETSGAEISGEDTAKLIKDRHIHGLGEMMNYPGVVSGNADVLLKLRAALAAGKGIDGHAPALSGRELNAYLCGGITSDHECTSDVETAEKISKGMYVHVRHGSTCRNLATAKNIGAFNFRRFLLCTDDRNAADLRDKGHIDDALRRIVKEYGTDPVAAVCCATLNAAECYGLKFRGAIAPFYAADLAAADDLSGFNVKYVFKDGVLVAENGKPLFKPRKKYLPRAVLSTVNCAPVSPADFAINLKGGRAKAIVLGKGTIVTGSETVEVRSEGGDVLLEGTPLLKLAVVERHRATGNIGRALLKGYGFSGGAVATTIAHDSHNIVVAGDDNASMAEAVLRLKEAGGGLAVVLKEGGAHVLPLRIGGLMSDLKCGEFIARFKEIEGVAHAAGVPADTEPSMSLAFLSLAVVPRLKLLDTGLFDVDKFAFTDLEDV